MAQREHQDTGMSCSSSLRLSVLSEDQLQAAVRLAKKDLHRKRQESIISQSHKTRAKSPSPDKNKTDYQQVPVTFVKCEFIFDVNISQSCNLH